MTDDPKNSAYRPYVWMTKEQLKEIYPMIDRPLISSKSLDEVYALPREHKLNLMYVLSWHIGDKQLQHRTFDLLNKESKLKDPEVASASGKLEDCKPSTAGSNPAGTL